MEQNKDIRKIVQSILKETSFVTSPYPKITTAQKLIKTAQRDGVLGIGYGHYVMDIAMEIAKKWDALSDEYKKIYRDDYYKDFLKKIKINESLNESIKLTADHGRSGSGTLSWYAEEYLLNLGSIIITNLDNSIQQELNMKLSMSKSSTKMVANSLVTKLIVDGASENGARINPEFVLTFNVNFEQDANTSGTVTYKGVTDTFNLGSKHSESDMSLFINEVVSHILNTIKIETKGK